MRRHYQIDLPIAGYKSSPRLVPVNVTSPMRLRSHLERFARYFLLEMNAGGMMFKASEAQTSPGFLQYKAFLFASQDRYVGGACFRFRDDQDVDTPWLFQWLWIHPYFRRRGVLTATWSEMRAQVGEFRLAEPVSSHMQSFLAKVGHSAA